MTGRQDKWECGLFVSWLTVFLALNVIHFYCEGSPWQFSIFNVLSVLIVVYAAYRLGENK